ncbi:hypothetical protein N0V83_002662 [Neocucurbitaria cava]|uniref:Uncharacterized protein n=1 Tax=Neocucurbitaria cava TaxID=798079 RepID=A0A9W9CPQ7_9PLEO|nr:hypothetical protein N0V83_002662 [Neocucurbitaria cava]
MNPPVIRIEDHTSQPPVTLEYHLGDNKLDFHTVYNQIKSLLWYRKCRRYPNDNDWPCDKCELAFYKFFWSCAAYLFDYFADFYVSDTPLMQSVWYYLLDIWQEGAAWLPYAAILEPPPNIYNLEKKTRAISFVNDVVETLRLLQMVMFGMRGKGIPRDSIIQEPSGEKLSPVGEYETGPWISGLKPWQQYLCEGSPGVAPPRHSLLLPNPNPSLDIDKTKDKSTADQQQPTASPGRIRHIPLPAIAIIHRHTSHARSLASSLFTAQDADTAADNVHAFDQRALKFPTTLDPMQPARSYTYTSPMTGQTVTYELTNGAPLIHRHTGLGDPTMELSIGGTWTLADECAAVCRGIEAYVVRGGGRYGGQQQQQGGGQGSGQGQGGDDNGNDNGDGLNEQEMEGRELGVFDMWSVLESPAVTGDEEEEEGEGGGAGAGAGGRKAVMESWGEMFDEWYGDDDDL